MVLRVTRYKYLSINNQIVDVYLSINWQHYLNMLALRTNFAYKLEMNAFKGCIFYVSTLDAG